MSKPRKIPSPAERAANWERIRAVPGPPAYYLALIARYDFHYWCD
jgi:hypothetical protein